MHPKPKSVSLAMMLVAILVSTRSDSAFSAIAVPQECSCSDTGCSEGCAVRRRHLGCRKCGSKKTCHRCPKCQSACCTLEVKVSDEKRTCYKTEQKVVCIPRVRFPWQKCCPPGVSRTRTVNVLKKHTYKCPTCKYIWNVQESESVPPPDMFFEDPAVILQPDASAAQR